MTGLRELRIAALEQGFRRNLERRRAALAAYQEARDELDALLREGRALGIGTTRLGELSGQNRYQVSRRLAGDPPRVRGAKRAEEA